MVQEKKTSKTSKKSPQKAEAIHSKKAGWSKQKRIAITTAISFGILLAALVLGGGIYYLGASVGLFPSQSIKKLVYQDLIEDENFISSAKEAAITVECRNPEYGLYMEYTTILIPRIKQISSTGPCMQFDLAANPNTKNPVVYLEIYAGSRKETVNTILNQLDQVKTESIPHSRYDVTKISGIKDLVEYNAFVFAVEEQTSWVIHQSPVTASAKKSVSKMVQSFMIGESEQ